jgi:hypothetical protein
MWQYFLRSLQNNPKDLTAPVARKITAFTLIGTYLLTIVMYWIALIILDKKWATDIFSDVTNSQLVAAGFFLGLVTVSQISEFRFGKNKTNQTDQIDLTEKTKSNETQEPN